MVDGEVVGRPSVWISSLRARLTSVSVVAAVAALVVFAFSMQALLAADPPEIEVLSENDTATDPAASVIPLASYSEAKGAIGATKMVLEFPGATALAKSTFDDISSIVSDDETQSITFLGSYPFNGGAMVDAALVLDWPTTPGEEFSVSLGVKASSSGVNLTSIDPSLAFPDGSDVVLGSTVAGQQVGAIVAFSTEQQSVGDMPGASSFYAGVEELGGGVTVQGTLPLGTVLPSVGDGAVVTITGELGATVEVFNPTGVINVDKLAVAGQITGLELDLPARAGSGDWAIGLEYDAIEDEVTVNGGALLTFSDPVLGSNPLELDVSLVASNGGAFAVQGALPVDDATGATIPWQNALGTSLSVDQLNAAFNGNTLTLTGAVRGGRAAGEVSVTVTDTSIEASLDFEEISIGSMVGDVASAFSGASVDVPSQLTGLKIDADIDFVYEQANDLLQAAALGTVTFGNDDGTSASVLVMFSKEGNDAPVGFVSASMDQLELGDLIPALADDPASADFAGITLPAVALRANDQDVDTSDYDGQVQTYLQSTFCSGAASPCTIASGIAMRGTFPVPASLKGVLEEMEIAVDSPFVIEGSADVFGPGGGNNFSLSVQLPEMNLPQEQDWFVSSNLAFSIVNDGSFSFSMTGKMTVKIPDESETTPYVAPGSMPQCQPVNGETGVDCVTFFIDTELSIDLRSASVSLTVTGGLDGFWSTPGGIDWLTFTQLKIQLQVTVGAGETGVVVGFRAGAQFCTDGSLANCAPANTKDLDASFAIGVRTPVPASPCNCAIDLGVRVASKAGVSLNDIVTIAEGASDLDVPTAVKDGLPDVSLKNIELMISSIDSPELCLSEGLRITADLYIGSMDTSGVPDAEDLVDGCRTVEEQLADGNTRCGLVDECYASVMFEVGANGIFVDASMSAINLGPVSITGAGDAPGPELRLVISESTQEFSISGGVTIDGFATARGSITVSNDGFALSVYVGEDKPAPQNFFQIDASASIGTAADPDALVFNLDVKLVLDLQDIIDAVYNDLFGWTGADYLEFRCIRLRAENVTVNSGSVIPSSGTISVGIHVMVAEEQGDPLSPRKLEVEWNFADDAGSNITSIIGDVFGGFQTEGPDDGCGLGGFIYPNYFAGQTARPESIVAREIINGLDTDAEVAFDGDTLFVVPRLRFPEPGPFDIDNVYDVTVGWGDLLDGTAETTETQSITNYTNGLPRPDNILNFEHVVDLASGATEETRTVTLTVTHRRTGLVFSASSPITIISGSPHSIGIDDPVKNTPNENYVETTIGFRPAGAEGLAYDARVIVDWGDGTTNTYPFLNNADTSLITATLGHPYPGPGTYEVTMRFETLSALGTFPVERTTSAIVENIAPYADGDYTDFASRDPQTNVITPMPLTGGLFGYGVLTLPEGHELLLTTEAVDENYLLSQPTKLVATIGPESPQDIPMTLSTERPVYETDNAPISIAGVGSGGALLTLTYSDNDGGSNSYQWYVAIRAGNATQANSESIGGTDVSASSNTYFSPIEAGEPNQADGRGGAVWWTFTPTVSGTYVVSDAGSETITGGDQETVITVYSSAMSQLGQGTEGGNGVTEAVAPNLVAGTSYFIGVQAVQATGDPGFNQDASGPVELGIALANPPANDNVADFTQLTLDGAASYPRWTASGTTIAATAQSSEPSHDGRAPGNSVWYLWSPEFPGTYELSVLGTDPRVAVYSLDGFDPFSLSPTDFPYPVVGSNDDDPAGGLNSLLSVEVAAGDYLIAVDAYDAAKQSAITLTVEPPAVSNGSEATREPLTQRVASRGSLLREDSVFYSFTVPYADGDWRFLLDAPLDLRVRITNDDQNRPFPCGVSLPGDPGGTCYDFSLMNLFAGESITIEVEGVSASDRSDFDLTILSDNDFDKMSFFYWNADGVDENFFILPSIEVNNFGASASDTGEQFHGGFLARQTTWAVLYAPDGDGIYEFTASARSGANPIDPVMAIYDVDPAFAANNNPTIVDDMDNLILRTVNDNDGGSSDSRIFTYLTDELPIYIMVDGVGGSEGIFDLAYEKVDVAHDAFENAIDLTTVSVNGNGLPVIEAVKAATTETGEPPHLGFSSVPSIWYTLDLTETGDGVVAVGDPSDLTGVELPDDFGVAIYKGTELANLEPVGGGFGGGTTTGNQANLPLMPVEFEAGETYYFAVFGNTDVEWTLAFDNGDPILPGDDIGDAEVIVGATSTTGSNVGADAEDNETIGSCFTESAPKVASSIWYRWRSSNDSTATVDTFGSSFDTQLAIYQTSPTGLVEIGCDDDAGGTLQSEVSFEPVAGEYYYFQVDGYAGNTGSISLTVGQAPSDAFHALEDICTPLSTGPLHAGADLDGPPIQGWGSGTSDTITFTVVGDIPASQLPFSPPRCEVPSTATAVFANIWVVNPSNEGNIIMSESGVTPTGGVLNFGGDGFKNSNAFTIPISANGELDLKLNAGPLNGTTEKMVDAFFVQVYGWYGPPEAGNTEYSEALEYVPVTPCMFLETRPNREPSAAFVGPYAPFTTKDVKVAGTFSGQGKLGRPGELTENTTCGVPDGTTHVMVNTEMVQTTGGAMGMQNLDNFFSFMAFNQPQNVPMNNASAVVVPLDSNGEMRFQMTGVGGATSNVRMSVLGYYQPVAEPGGFTFHPLTPCAVFDSRPNKGSVGGFAGIRVGGQTTTYEVRGTFDTDQGGGNNNCGIPFDAVATDISIEAVNAVREGNVVVSAAGEPASGGVLNFALLSPKMNNANAVTVPLSASGEIDVFVNAGSFAVGQDTAFIRGVVTGYYTEG